VLGSKLLRAEDQLSQIERLDGSRSSITMRLAAPLQNIAEGSVDE
jgi:hypothetical protein